MCFAVHCCHVLSWGSPGRGGVLWCGPSEGVKLRLGEHKVRSFSFSTSGVSMVVQATFDGQLCYVERLWNRILPPIVLKHEADEGPSWRYLARHDQIEDTLQGMTRTLGAIQPAPRLRITCKAWADHRPNLNLNLNPKNCESLVLPDEDSWRLDGCCNRLTRNKFT